MVKVDHVMEEFDGFTLYSQNAHVHRSQTGYIFELVHRKLWFAFLLSEFSGMFEALNVIAKCRKAIFTL